MILTVTVAVGIVGLLAAIGCFVAIEKSKPGLGFVSVAVLLFCVWLIVRLGAVHA